MSLDDGPTEPSTTRQHTADVVDDLRTGQLHPQDIPARLDGPNRPIMARATVRTLLHDPTMLDGVIDEVIDHLVARELARPVAESLLDAAEEFRRVGLTYGEVMDGSLDALDYALRQRDTVRLGDTSMLFGGGASEAVLAAELRAYSESIHGREQLTIDATADAFDTVPQTLADAVGLDPLDTTIDLRVGLDNGDILGVDTTMGDLRDVQHDDTIAIDEAELEARLTDGVALAGAVCLTKGTVTQLGTLTGHHPY